MAVSKVVAIPKGIVETAGTRSNHAFSAFMLLNFRERIFLIPNIHVRRTEMLSRIPFHPDILQKIIIGRP